MSVTCPYLFLAPNLDEIPYSPPYQNPAINWPSDIYSGLPNGIKVVVRNAMDTAAYNVAVRLYWTQDPSDRASYHPIPHCPEPEALVTVPPADAAKPGKVKVDFSWCTPAWVGGTVYLVATVEYSAAGCSATAPSEPTEMQTSPLCAFRTTNITPLDI